MPKETIVNYTTGVEASKTVAEIQTLLQTARAEAVLTEYGDVGGERLPVALSFRIKSPAFGIISFRLPARIEEVFKVLARMTGVANRFRTRSQAARVAWRVIKHWTEAQLAVIKIGSSSFEELFLSYAQTTDGNSTGETLYERHVRDRFRGLALTAPSAP